MADWGGGEKGGSMVVCVYRAGTRIEYGLGGSAWVGEGLRSSQTETAGWFIIQERFSNKEKHPKKY